MDFRKTSGIKWLLPLAVLVVRCRGQSPSQTREAHGDWIHGTDTMSERVQFEEEECAYPKNDEGQMNNPKVTVCINPCGSNHIVFRGNYGVDGKRFNIRLNESIPSARRDSPFSVSLEFIETVNSVSLNLSSKEINGFTSEQITQSPIFKSWTLTYGTHYLPFRVISDHTQCGFPTTTRRTTPSSEVTTLSTASMDETKSTEDRQSEFGAIFAENKLAFIAGGGLGIFSILVLITVWCVRRRRSRSKSEVQKARGDSVGEAGSGGITQRCSVNSIYDSSAFPKPLERHESINSLYGAHDDFTASQDSSVKLNQLLKPPCQGYDSPNIYEPV